MFVVPVFQQTVDIPIGTNCAPLITYLFRYSYEKYFIQRLLKKNADDVRLLNNSRLVISLISSIPLSLN